MLHAPQSCPSVTLTQECPPWKMERLKKLTVSLKSNLNFLESYIIALESLCQTLETNYLAQPALAASGQTKLWPVAELALG